MIHELRTRIGLLWREGRLRSFRRGSSRSQPCCEPTGNGTVGRWTTARVRRGFPPLEAALISLAIGCSGATQPADTPPPTPPPAEPSPPPLPVAPTPPHLVAWASMPTPGSTVDTALSWAAVNLQWRPLLSVVSGPLAAVLPLVHWDAPLDAAVALDPVSNNRPRLLVAASVGLTSLQGAIEAFRAHELPLQLIGADTHLVQLTPEFLCFLGAARGLAPARLVCSDKQQALEELQPYLARGQRPVSATDTDLRAEAYFPYAWEKFGDKAMVFQRALPLLLGELATGDPQLDAAVRQLANRLSLHVLEAAAELSTVHLDVHLSEPLQAAEVELGVQLNPGRSWLNRALADASAAMGPAPERFWQLPADASHLGYRHCSDANSAESTLQATLPLLEAALQHAEVSKPIEHQVLSAVRTMTRYCGTLVAAGGRKPDAGTNASVPGSRYVVLAAEADSQAAIPALLDSGIALYQDLGFRNWLTRSAKVTPSEWPSLRAAAGTGLLSGATVYHLSPSPEASPKPDAKRRRFPAVDALEIVFGTREGTSFLGLSDAPIQQLEAELSPLLELSETRQNSPESPRRVPWLRDSAVNAAAVIDIRETPLPARAAQALSEDSANADGDISLVLQTHSATKPNGGVMRLRAPKHILRSVGALVRP